MDLYRDLSLLAHCLLPPREGVFFGDAYGNDHHLAATLVDSSGTVVGYALYGIGQGPGAEMQTEMLAEFRPGEDWAEMFFASCPATSASAASAAAVELYCVQAGKRR